MKRKLIPLACAGFSAFPALADEPAMLDDIVVTATRTAQTADEALQSVTVITRKDIEHAHAGNLLELLNGHAGINIGRTGGEGKGASVYMRGTFARHVLVLVDGVRAAAATTGEYDWNALSPDQIERIEIVRGPRASLYGSDAVGGVVQIFTRKVRGPAASATAGSHGTRSIGVATGGGKDWTYSVQAGHYLTDGTPIFMGDRVRYGFDRSHAGLALDGRLSGTLSLAFRLNQASGQNDNDPATGSNDYVNRTASMRVTHQAAESWLQTFTLGQALDSYTSYSPYTPATIETRRQSLSWQNDVSLAQGLLSLGVDHWNDHATKDRSGTVDQRIGNTGLFAQYQAEALGSDWQLGARRDQHDVFGGRNTWNVSWGREIHEGLQLLASYATAFKAPSVNDFFWPNSTSYSGVYSFLGTFYSDTYASQGNPALRPERSRSAEMGIRFRGKSLTASAMLHESRIRDLIEWTSDTTAGGGSGANAGDPVLTTYTYYPANIRSARIRGLELSAATEVLGWALKADYTRLLATNLTTGKQLDRRPANSLSLGATRAVGPHRITLQAEGYSRRNDSSGTRVIPGYGLFNAGYEYTLARDLVLGVRMDNLLDEDYALARTSTRYYAAPGRSVFISLHYTPK